MTLQRTLVVAAALLYLGIGIGCSIAPMALLADVGVTSVDDRGIIELRAMYGGVQLGMGAYLLWCAKNQVTAGLMAATMTIGGLGLMRFLGWLALQPEGWLLPALCGVELGGATLGIVALVRGPRT